MAEDDIFTGLSDWWDSTVEDNNLGESLSNAQESLSDTFSEGLSSVSQEDVVNTLGGTAAVATPGLMAYYLSSKTPKRPGETPEERRRRTINNGLTASGLAAATLGGGYAAKKLWNHGFPQKEDTMILPPFLSPERFGEYLTDENSPVGNKVLPAGGALTAGHIANRFSNSREFANTQSARNAVADIVDRQATQAAQVSDEAAQGLTTLGERLKTMSADDVQKTFPDKDLWHELQSLLDGQPDEFGKTLTPGARDTLLSNAGFRPKSNELEQLRNAIDNSNISNKFSLKNRLSNAVPNKLPNGKKGLLALFAGGAGLGLGSGANAIINEGRELF